MASCCVRFVVFSVVADSSGEQILALFQKHRGTTKCLTMRLSMLCCEDPNSFLLDAVIKVLNS